MAKQRNPTLLHAPLGERQNIGNLLAAFLEGELRSRADPSIYTSRDAEMLPLCPGCTEIIAFYMLIRLTDDQGRDRKELAESMIDAFTALRDNPSDQNVAMIENSLEALLCQEF